MGLSSELISQFVKVTNDSKKTKPKETTVYGTVKSSGGRMYVQLDGSSLLTPVITATTMGENDRVTVMIKNHSAVVTGNLSSPSASNDALLNLAEDLGILDGNIGDALGSINGEIGDINNAFGLLVQTVSEINDDLVETGQNVVANTNNISTNAGNIATNKNNISSLTKRMGTAESNITTNKNNISSLTTRVGNVENNYLPKSGGFLTGTLYPLMMASEQPNGASGRNHVVLLPHVPYQNIEPNHDTVNYLKELLKWTCKTYPNVPANCNTFIGSAAPNSLGTIIFNIYNTKDVQDGLPRYSSGIFINLDLKITLFGTSSYAYRSRDL